MKVGEKQDNQPELTPLKVALSASLRRMADCKLFIVLDFLELVSGSSLQLVQLTDEAEIAFISNIDIAPKSYRRQIRRTSKPEVNFERIVREMTSANTTVIVSFENLQHPAWVRFGDLLGRSRIPRMTHLPQSVDKQGVRLPYWWNHLDWPDFPRPEADYQRFGRLYSLERLMQPVPRVRNRKKKAVWVGSYLNEPRASLLRHAESTFGLDTFGEQGQPFNGPKASILEKYQFAVGAENSLGVGYDSEKVPEVWDAGCLPVSTFLQPFSDFNPLSLNSDDPFESHRHPLLLREPNPNPVLDYLRQIMK